MRVSVAFERLAGLLAALMLAVPLAALASPAAAQGEPEFYDTPFAPEQWKIGRRLDESQLRYCVDPRDPEWEVAGAVADAVAGALLLEPVRYVVPSQQILEDLTKVYAIMLEHCDLYMGFRLIPEGYPEWVTITGSYYDAQYVFVATNPDIHALADLPPKHKIGATIGSQAHIRLVSYLTALPVDQRWQAFPYGSDDLSLSALLDGTVDVALVWGPTLWAKQRADQTYAAVHIIDPNPLPPTTLGVGALMLSNQTFLRNAVDEAIKALRADGTIQGIIESNDFPATAAP